LASIEKELSGKQTIIPGKPANYLMTYGGVAGAVGAIKITQSISTKTEDQRGDVIPTEKAIGELLSKIGIIDSGDSTNTTTGVTGTVRWSQIVGRPAAYQELGDNDDGFVTQDVITKYIKELQTSISDKNDETDGIINTIKNQVTNHIANMSNPHNITVDQIGAVSTSEFEFHLNAENPHNVTKDQIGLGNVDNTADIDKPISNAVQAVIDEIKESIHNMSDDTGSFNFVTNVDYVQSSGELTITYRDQSKGILNIPINGLISDIAYDSESKKILVHELGGTTKNIDVSELYTNYVGSTSSEMTVSIDDNVSSGEQIIKASINEHGIETGKIADEAIDSRTIKEGAVTAIKIRDGAISNIKIAASAVTSDKIGASAITSTKLADRAVDGRSLFSSQYDNRVLIVNEAGTDPIWSQISADMLGFNSINAKHIENLSITTVKLADNSITNVKIENNAVTTEKISERAITNEKIESNTIEGIKLVENIVLQGTPSITTNPSSDSDSKELATTSWVRQFTTNSVFTSDNIGRRTITADKIFTSPNKDRILAVTTPSGDPEWTTINHEMLNDGIIENSNIKDLAVTKEKIADKSIEHRHLTADIIETTNIVDSAITSEKMWISPNKNVVLGVTKENSHPVYTTINGDMLDDNTISTNKIQDLSVTPSKITSSSTSNRLMGVVLSGSTPQWLQANNGMIGNRAIDGRTLFSSPQDNMVLATTIAGNDPGWLKVSSEMIGEKQIKSDNIADGVIRNEHLAEKIIESKHIMDWSITSNNIAPRAITGIELFTSPVPNRVLAVTSMPYSNPDWLQVTTDMIEDCAITKEKIFTSDYDYRVLATTNAGTPPEYIKITGNFIVDDSINPQKLVKDFVLFGTPELTKEPYMDADNLQIANTAWVRKVVANMINDFNPEILFETITSDMIENHSIDGTKLMTSDEGPRVLGVTAAGDDVEYLLIEENLIADGAVTSNKIQRDVHLMGSPVVEIRPGANASDNEGTGSLIPDCQWVLDRIKEASLSAGTTNTSNTVQPILVEDIDSIINGETLSTSDDYEVSDDGSILKGIAVEDIESIVDAVDDIDNNDSTTENGYTIQAISDDEINGITDGTYVIEKQDTTGTGSGYTTSTSSGSTSSSGSTGTSVTLTKGSVVTDYIQDRAVTGAKLFTSVTINRVLAVTSSNADPEYTQVTSAMIANRNVTGKNLFTSNLAYRALVVKDAKSNPEWGQIEGAMIADGGIKSDHIARGAITSDKIADLSVNISKLAEEPIIDNQRLYDNSVTTDKIKDASVETSKIKDNAITSKKLNTEIELPAKTTVKEDTNYERRAVRNTILSPNAPSGGMNGDIWFRYI
jgi:hypothetical protein